MGELSAKLNLAIVALARAVGDAGLFSTAGDHGACISGRMELLSLLVKW